MKRVFAIGYRIAPMVLAILMGSGVASAEKLPEQVPSNIRSLSAEEIRGLRDGEGMGLARAAELNGYPGPTHVLEAAREGKIHLFTAGLLRPEQIEHYTQFRGYATASPGHGQGH